MIQVLSGVQSSVVPRLTMCNISALAWGLWHRIAWSNLPFSLYFLKHHVHTQYYLLLLVCSFVSLFLYKPLLPICWMNNWKNEQPQTYRRNLSTMLLKHLKNITEPSLNLCWCYRLILMISLLSVTMFLAISLNFKTDVTIWFAAAAAAGMAATSDLPSAIPSQSP